MKRQLGIVFSIVALGALGAAVAAWAGPRHHGGGGKSFTVVEHATTDATTDTGAAGDSAGDVLTFANEVFNRADTHRVAVANQVGPRATARGLPCGRERRHRRRRRCRRGGESRTGAASVSERAKRPLREQYAHESSAVPHGRSPLDRPASAVGQNGLAERRDARTDGRLDAASLCGERRGVICSRAHERHSRRLEGNP